MTSRDGTARFAWFQAFNIQPPGFAPRCFLARHRSQCAYSSRWCPTGQIHHRAIRYPAETNTSHPIARRNNRTHGFGPGDGRGGLGGLDQIGRCRREAYRDVFTASPATVTQSKTISWLNAIQAPRCGAGSRCPATTGAPIRTSAGQPVSRIARSRAFTACRPFPSG